MAKRICRFMLRVMLVVFTMVSIMQNTAMAALIACKTDKDCVASLQVCRAVTLPQVPEKICVNPAFVMPGIVKDGADVFEHLQEQVINRAFSELIPRMGDLQVASAQELETTLTREQRKNVVDFNRLASAFDKSYTSVAKLDAYERILLLRYLKRQVATSIEKNLLIALDIINHPNAVVTDEVESLNQRIKAEETRLASMYHDLSALCNQYLVIESLSLRRADAIYQRDMQKIEVSNLTPEQREKKIKYAQFRRQQKRQAASAIPGALCSRTESATTTVPTISHTTNGELSLFTLYSLDPPSIALVANAEGIPELTSSTWERATIGKSALQKTTQDQQRQRLNKARKAPQLKLYNEKSDAYRRQKEEHKKAEDDCAEIFMSVANMRDAIVRLYRSERESIKAMMEAIGREFVCPSGLNAIGCADESAKFWSKHVEPLQRSLHELDDKEKQDLAKLETERLAAEQSCANLIEAVGKNFRLRMNSLAEHEASIPTSVSQDNPASLPNYDTLQDYDSNNTFTLLDPVSKWFLKRVGSLIGSGAMGGYIQHVRKSAGGSVMAKPIGTLEIASQFADLAKVQSEHDKACWALGLHQIVLNSMMDTESMGLNKAMNDFINFPRPGETSSRSCPWAAQP